MSLSEATAQERDQFYEEHRCTPTKCERAAILPRVQWIQHENQLKPFKRVLDVGCHDGFSTRWLLDSPFLDELVGVDLCEEAITYAKELAQEKVFPELATYIQGSVFDYQKPNHFDVVVAFELLEHFPEEEARGLLRYAHDQIEVGGTVYLTTPHVDGIYGEQNPDPSHITFFDPEKLRAWIKEETGAFAAVGVIGDILHSTWRRPCQSL